MSNAAEEILNLVRNLGRERVVIAIDGKCASGKTAVARELHTMCGCNVIHTDDFFPQNGHLTDSAVWLDSERLEREVLIPLSHGECFTYRPYSCHTQGFLPGVAVGLNALTVVEGSYSCQPALRGYYDLCFFFTTTYERQLSRIEAREGSEALRMFCEKWIPTEEKYFNTYNIKNCCDRVITT